MSTLAPAAPEAGTLVNPLTIVDDTAKRVDAAVTAMVDSVVGTVEEELKRLARRREVRAAVWRVYEIRAECDRMVPGMKQAPGMADLLLRGYRDDLVAAFVALNGEGQRAEVETVVDQFLDEYREKAGVKEVKKRGKSSGG